MLKFQRWFLPESFKSQTKNQQIRAKFIAVNASASVLWGPLVVLVVLYLESPVSAFLIGVGALFSLLGAFILKYTSNLSVATGVYLGGIFSMLVLLSQINGGTNLSGFVWMLIIPLLAIDSMGDRAGLIALAGCLLLLMGLKVAESLGYVFPSETSEAGHDTFRFISLVVILVMTWAIGSAYSKLMRSALRKERELSEAKTKFISNVSHELRTPLNGIIGMLEVIEQKHAGADFIDDLETIRHSSNHLLALVNEILDLTKVDTLHQSSRTERYNIHNNIQRTINSLMAVANKKGVKLGYVIGEAVDAELVGDPTKLEQLLLNLLSNALKFTEHGEICLTLKEQAVLNGKVALYFEVSDTGIGIPEKSLKHLFEPFYQVDDSLNRQQVGSGLGLAISKSIVESLGGKISVSSEEGEGTTFKFHILQERFDPLQVEDLPAEARPAEPESQISDKQVKPEPSSATTDGATYRVLLVEDNSINQMILKRMLEFKGHGVTVADNGVVALESIKSQRFDIVFMDMQMPVMDGIECSRQIRQHYSQSLPIIAVTANVSANDEKICRQAGMNDVIHKPLLAKSVYAVMDRWLAS